VTDAETEISKFDIPPKQILLKFNIVEVYKNDGKEIGTDWGSLFRVVDVSAGYNYNSNTQQSFQQNIEIDNRSAKSTGLNGGVRLNFYALADFIKILSEKRMIKLVADNSLLCMNNLPSTFSFDCSGKSITVTMTPSAIGDKTLLLKSRVVSDNKVLLENSIISEIGASNLLLRFDSENSQSADKSVPVLGTALPFIFSRNNRSKDIASIDILCTPVVQIVNR
jgi:hypothetical protein